MAFEFRLPDIGEGLTEAEITDWLVEVGQEVAVDEPLVRVETDKAVTELPSPRAGVVLHRGAPEGSVVKVGDIVAVIGAPGETWSPEARPTAEPARAEPFAPIVGSLVEAPAQAEGTGSPQALPAVRKLARDLGVDLASVTGTGPGGRVTRDDVERAGSGDGDERRPLSKLRRTIADAMARSWREIPHVTTFGEADAAALLRERAAVAERLGEPFPLEALLVRAVLPALSAHPEFNATLDGPDLVLHRRHDVGVAVDTPDGLLVGVLRDADARTLVELGREIRRLAEAVRSRSATPGELTGATFTISNIGAVGGGHGTPVIPFGTTAIMSFGRAAPRPVVAHDGLIEVGTVMPLSLSYDHRVIDGALGRRFLAAVVRSLEDPSSLSA